MTEISASGSRLMKEFATDTEHKAIPEDAELDFDQVDDDEGINTDDYGDHSSDDFEEEPINTDDAGAGGRSDHSQFLSVETSASLYVGVFDSLQDMLLTTLHKWKLKRKIGNDKELERFEEISASVEDGLKQFEDLEIADRAKIRILNRVKKKVEDLPFTDMEYEQLEESLILILKEMPGYQLPPNYALIMAMANVMLPRILDVVVD